MGLALYTNIYSLKMTTLTPQLNEAVLEAEEAIEELESMDKARLKKLLEKAQQYVASATESVDNEEFCEESGCMEGYVASIILDRNLDVVRDDVIEVRDESFTKEDELKLQELQERLNALLSD